MVTLAPSTCIINSGGVNQKTILFGVLNWGLGHASRSIPVIRNLLSNSNVTVILAADGAAYNLLSKEFPFLPIERVEDVKIRYKKGVWLPFGLLATGIKLHLINRKEHRQVAALVDKYAIDVVISDNRYGFWNINTSNFIITHQLSVLPPNGFGFTAALFRKIIKHKLAPFTEVWVPDQKEEPGFAGILSHQPKAHPQIRYIGLLSRYFQNAECNTTPMPLVAIVSGPMPFRKQLAEALIQLAEHRKTPLILFTNNLQLKSSSKYMEVRQNTSFKELNQSLNQAEIVIASGGYTTIMDLWLLQKKAILIPTPGQTEQAYLAKTNQNRWPFVFLSFSQLPQLFEQIEQIKRDLGNENSPNMEEKPAPSFIDFINNDHFVDENS